MIRSRDVVALLAALLLTRMAWNDTTESLRASVHLAFYYPRDKATALSPMDVDGDGTSEALAVIQRSSSNWEWKILDLKALSPRPGSVTNHALPPFQPSVLFSYLDTTRESTVSPLQIVTGQVLIKPTGAQSRKMLDMSHVNPETEITERNRHFFCGGDWHDASQKCSHPCPSGQASECPGEERCYADTSCNLETLKNEDMQVLFELTPGGGLPSMVTLWSDGVLAMTSITNDATQKTKGTPLELKSMWKVEILPNGTRSQNIQWIEHNILFLDAYDSSDTTGAEHGMIIVSGIYVDESNIHQEKGMTSILVAVEAMNGKVLWNTLKDTRKNDEPIPLPVTRGTSSFARRRSRIISQGEEVAPNHLLSLPDCQVTFRQHLKLALPYAYWTAKDSHLAAVHLDQSKKPLHHRKEKGKSHPVIGKDSPRLPAPKKKWHHKFHNPRHIGPPKGRPNVIVLHTKGGMQIRSLKNGFPLCHMSLLEETLYADLNNDGTLDQVQVLIPSKKVDQNDEWISALLTKLEKNNDASSASHKDEAARAARMAVQGNSLCHALGLSGVPAREELFSTSLCGSAHDQVPAHPSIGLDTVTPIVVESLSGRRNTRDVVVALNNGMVHRLHGHSGRKEWSLVGKYHSNFPIWDETNAGSVTMGRVQSPSIPPPIRPIILVGEHSVAVLSVKNGNLLATAPFPQTSDSRPILADTTGDGTTDVIVTSLDGIWGYQIQVQAGRPVVLRILVGILLLCVMLAILRNRFSGERKDVRATDL